MKTRIMLMLLLAFTSINPSQLQASNYEKVVEKTVMSQNARNTLRVGKKEIKKDLKRRKKLHKSLLSLYNESFQDIYFKLIEVNAGKIQQLRNELSKLQ